MLWCGRGGTCYGGQGVVSWGAVGLMCVPPGQVVLGLEHLELEAILLGQKLPPIRVEVRLEIIVKVRKLQFFDYSA